MCAITRSGHAVLDNDSCVRCLWVNCDFLRRLVFGEIGEDAKKGGGEDMVNGQHYAAFIHNMLKQSRKDSSRVKWISKRALQRRERLLLDVSSPEELLCYQVSLGISVHGPSQRTTAQSENNH